MNAQTQAHKAPHRRPGSGRWPRAFLGHGGQRVRDFGSRPPASASMSSNIAPATGSDGFRIGRHGSPWTPDAARSEAIRILGDVSRGLDPGGARKSARVAMTFSELCDLYFAEGVANKKPSTLRFDRTRARLHLVPLLGSKRVEVLTRDDIEQMRAAVESGRSIARGPEKRGPGSVAKGGPGAAAQCVEASTSRRFGRSSAFFRPRSSGASPTRCRRDRADECCARGRGDLAARVHRLPTRRDRHPEMGGSRPRTPFPEFARFEDRQEDRPPERTCGRNT